MNKVILQISLLGFFLSLIYFNMQNVPLVESIIRSFIILVGIALITLVFFNIVRSITISAKRRRMQEENAMKMSAQQKSAAKKGTAAQNIKS